MTDPKLKDLRGAVQRLSSDILDLVSQRARVVLDIAEHKRHRGQPLRDAHRESELLEALVAKNQGPFDDATVRTLFRGVLDASLALMGETERKGLKVGASGGPRVVIDVRGKTLGGGTPTYIAGPCSVESEEQMDTAARGLAALGVTWIRGGAFKPRTSPYAFQGLGEEGLKLLSAAARRHDMRTVCEATAFPNIQLVAEYCDVIQVGARNSQSFEFLREVGRMRKPVLLKRGFATTLDEWLNAAEYVALGGSEQIMLCERGIRTFATETRSTLDLSIVPLARAASRLPVCVDVSHAAGRRDILAPLSQAAFAVGADAVMIEVHPDPDAALSDAQQQLSIEGFAALQKTVGAELRRLASQL